MTTADSESRDELDDGWDEVDAPSASSESPDVALDHVDAGWELEPEQPAAEQVARGRPLTSEARRGLDSAVKYAAKPTKKERRELARKKRAQAAQREAERKLARKQARQERARERTLQLQAERVAARREQLEAGAPIPETPERRGDRARTRRAPRTNAAPRLEPRPMKVPPASPVSGSSVAQKPRRALASRGVVGVVLALVALIIALFALLR